MRTLHTISFKSARANNQRPCLPCIAGSEWVEACLLEGSKATPAPPPSFKYINLGLAKKGYAHMTWLKIDSSSRQTNRAPGPRSQAKHQAMEGPVVIG